MPKPVVKQASVSTPARMPVETPLVRKDVRPVTAQLPAVIDDRGHYEQLIVEPRRVTTVIRLVDNGHTTEYRRVAHAYGAVFFFRNGESCAEGTFEAARAH